MELYKVSVSLVKWPDRSFSFKTLDSQLKLNEVAEVRMNPLFKLNPKLRSWYTLKYLIRFQVFFGFIAWVAFGVSHRWWVHIDWITSLLWLDIVFLDTVVSDVYVEAVVFWPYFKVREILLWVFFCPVASCSIGVLWDESVFVRLVLSLHLLNNSVLVSLVEVQENSHVFTFNAEEGENVSPPKKLIAYHFLKESLNIMDCLLRLWRKYFSDIHIFPTFPFISLLWIFNRVFRIITNIRAPWFELQIPLFKLWFYNSFLLFHILIELDVFDNVSVFVELLLN